MATARQFRAAGDQVRIEWFTVEDDAGAIWTYRRTATPVDASAVVHVRWENNGQQYVPVLVRGSDGQPLLRQEGPGLPESAVLSFDDPPMRGTRTGVAAGGSGLMAAERAEFVQSSPQRSEVKTEDLAVDPNDLSK